MSTCEGPKGPSAVGTTANYIKIQRGDAVIILIRQLATIFLLLLVCAEAYPNVSTKDDLHAISQQLGSVKLRALPPVVAQLESSGEAALPLLEALLSGGLFARKSDKRVLIGMRQGDGSYLFSDAITAEILPKVSKSHMKKIIINNRLRGQIRDIIARVTLTSVETNIRTRAIKNMFNKMTAENILLLRQAREVETEAAVITLIDLALAVYDLTNATAKQTRLESLDLMAVSLEPLVFNTLATLLALDPEGNPLEGDPDVRAKAKKIYTSMEKEIRFYERLEQFFYGLSLGSVLLLIATGLAITFGVMGVINMAHGELIMIGAYTTYVVQLLMPNNLEYSILVAIPMAFLMSGFVGVLIQYSVIRFLHGRPLETLLATFGISLILQQAVRSIFSPLNRQIISPSWLSGSLEINAVFSLTYNRLFILIFALLVFACLQLILKKTSLGLHVRAVSQNRGMAKAIGIRTEWVDAMTFGLGSGIAGIAGVALSQLTNVGPNLGQAYLIDSFMVVVFGGVGNLWGTLVGSFTLGVANKFLEPITGAVLANIIVLVSIILFIQKRPRGLFPQKGRAAE